MINTFILYIFLNYYNNHNAPRIFQKQKRLSRETSVTSHIFQTIPFFKSFFIDLKVLLFD